MNSGPAFPWAPHKELQNGLVYAQMEHKKSVQKWCQKAQGLNYKIKIYENLSPRTVKGGYQEHFIYLSPGAIW